MTLTKPGAKKQRLANDCSSGPADVYKLAHSHQTLQTQANATSASAAANATSATAPMTSSASATVLTPLAGAAASAACAADAASCASSNGFSSDQVDCICEVLIRGNSHEKLSQFLDSLPTPLRSRSSESLLKARVLMAYVQVCTLHYSEFSYSYMYSYCAN